MNYVFFGSDDFSVTVLNELKKAGLFPALVVTKPDRPKGRGLRTTPPPVKLWAQENQIPFLQPAKLDSFFNLELSTYNLQLFAVASYGLIIPKHILDIPKYGTLNVHPSLLPKYRGATPIESQILADEKEVGVTIMLMDERMDHGPILAKRELEIRNTKYEIRNKSQNTNIQIASGAKLRKKLAEEGGKLLAEVMPKWVAGEIKAAPQDHTRATYTRKFTKADGEIDLHGDPYKNFLKIRAFEGGIGTFFYKTAEQTLNKNTERDGTIPRRFRVGGVPLRFRALIKSAEYKDGKLIIIRVVPEGRKETSYDEFLRGLK